MRLPGASRRVHKPDEDWYWPVENIVTQVFSRCLISPCSSHFDNNYVKAC